MSAETHLFGDVLQRAEPGRLCQKGPRALARSRPRKFLNRTQKLNFIPPCTSRGWPGRMPRERSAT